MIVFQTDASHISTAAILYPSILWVDWIPGKGHTLEAFCKGQERSHSSQRETVWNFTRALASGSTISLALKQTEGRLYTEFNWLTWLILVNQVRCYKWHACSLEPWHPACNIPLPETRWGPHCIQNWIGEQLILANQVWCYIWHACSLKPWHPGLHYPRPKKKMFVSGNPTLPGNTPPTLKFFLGFWKKYFEKWRKISKNGIFGHIFEE